mgnify:CR=1 FL=1
MRNMETAVVETAARIRNGMQRNRKRLRRKENDHEYHKEPDIGSLGNACGSADGRGILGDSTGGANRKENATYDGTKHNSGHAARAQLRGCER